MTIKINNAMSEQVNEWIAGTITLSAAAASETLSKALCSRNLMTTYLDALYRSFVDGSTGIIDSKRQVSEGLRRKYSST